MTTQQVLKIMRELLNSFEKRAERHGYKVIFDESDDVIFIKTKIIANDLFMMQSIRFKFDEGTIQELWQVNDHKFFIV